MRVLCVSNQMFQKAEFQLDLVVPPPAPGVEALLNSKTYADTNRAIVYESKP